MFLGSITLPTHLCVSCHPLQITLYDTAGMERFEGTVPPTYFRNAFAVIFVYAINSQESINNIASWADSISYQRIGDTSKTIVKALVGNKTDLENDREVSTTRSKATAEQAEIKEHLVFEVSALSGDGVDRMFSTIAKELKGTHKEPKFNDGLPPPRPRPNPCCSGSRP